MDFVSLLPRPAVRLVMDALGRKGWGSLRLVSKATNVVVTYEIDSLELSQKCLLGGKEGDGLTTGISEVWAGPLSTFSRIRQLNIACGSGRDI